MRSRLRSNPIIFSFLLILCGFIYSTHAAAYSLAGTVYLGANPLTDTKVTLLDAVTNNSISTIMTDTAGAYQFNLENGNYNLSITPPAELGLSSSIVEDVAIHDSDLTYHVVLIEPEVIVNGVVTSTDGTPASGVQVAIYNQHNGINVGVVTTTDSGIYSIPLAKSDYYINVQGYGKSSNIELPEYWRIAPVKSDLSIVIDTTVNITLPTVSLSGVISNTHGNPVADVTLRTEKGWSSNGTYYLVNNNSGITKSNSDGSYLIPLLGNANYDIAVMPASNSGLAATALHVEFSSADKVQNVVLNDANKLSGQVAISNGSAIAGVELYLFDSSSNVNIGSTITDRDGKYSFPVSSGVYHLQAGGNGRNHNIPMPGRWYINPIAKDVVITGNRTLNLVIPTVGLIAQINDGSGRPVASAQLQYNESWTRDGVNYSATSLSDAIVSDADGSIATNLFRHNDYDFNFVVAGSGEYTDTAFQNIIIDGDLRQQFTINDSYSVTGMVHRPDGLPLNNVQVMYYDLSSGRLIAQTRTNVSGIYSVTVSSGRFRVDVRGQGNILVDGMPQNWFVSAIVNDLEIGANTVQDIVIPVKRVSGSVSDSSGNMVDGTSFVVNNTWVDNGSRYVVNNAENYVLTDRDGNYSFYTFSYNDYHVTIVPPSDIDLVNETISNVDLSSTQVQDFIFSPTIILEGKVKTPEGQPVSGVVLTLFDKATNLTSATYTTTTDGGYRFPVISGEYAINASGNGMSSNFPLPSYWHIKPILTSIIMTGNKVIDIVLPVATISGKTTDSNGVAVANVEFLFNQIWREADIDYRVQTNTGHYRSASDGSYQLSLLFADSYSETVVPPRGSGFSSVTINDLQLNKSIKQNVILVFADTQAPKIIAGPYVRNISDTGAMVVWQTDEPATSIVNFGSPGITSQAGSNTHYVTEHAVQLSSLSADTLYQLKVSSTDQHGNGATESTLINFTTLSVPDTQAPLLINGPTVSSITDNSAVIEWQTNETADSQLQYGVSGTNDPQPSDLVYTITDSDAVTHHYLQLNGLTASTVYTLQVSSTDVAGNGPVSSRLAQFITQAQPDNSAPVIISGPMVIDITSTSASIVWTTDEPATSGVSYHDVSAYGVVSDTQYTVEHIIHLTNLTPNHEYQFTVSSMDRFDNGPSLSNESTFVTQPVVDVQPPVLTLEPEIVVTTHQSAVIRWQTDEPADSVIEYGLKADNLDQVETRAALVTNHNVPLVGLNAQQEYFFRVSSIDAAGNRLQSNRIYSFYTVNGRDNLPPALVQAPLVIGSTDKTVTLEWVTDEYSKAYIDIENDDEEHRHIKRQISQSYDDNKLNNENRHQVTVTGLKPSSSYTFSINMADVSGNSTVIHTKDVSLVLKTQGEQDIDVPTLVGDIRITNIEDDSAIIEWDSDELADSLVVFNESGHALTRQQGTIDYTLRHRVMLTKLEPGTPYQFRIISNDVAGNRFESDSVYEFVTSYTNDTDAPVISAVNSHHITYSSAIIDWETDDFSRSQLHYGVFADNLDNIMNSVEYKQNHGFALLSLAQGITYYYQLSSTDMAGNQSLSEIYSFTTLGTAIDTDHDGEADALDLDDDNDGIPDAVELRYGLNTLSATDALKDADQDGMNNLEEYRLGTNLLQDTVAPVISPLADINIASTGMITSYPLIRPAAFDALDGKINAISNHNNYFKSGKNTVVWTATDSAGNTSQSIQHINVIPQANLTIDQLVGEGGQAKVEIQLNGNAVSYPVTLHYEITGTATMGQDYRPVPGVVSIAEGTNAVFYVDIIQDAVADSDETIDIKLTSAVNAVIGPTNSHTITIVEHNLAPMVSIVAEQGGQVTRVIAKDAGLFALSVEVKDSNSTDSHWFDWSATDNNLLSYATQTESGLRIDPAYLTDGIYLVRIRVTDDGIPALSTEVDLPIHVIAHTVHLSDGSDSDADGITDALEAFADDDRDGVYDYLDNIVDGNVLQTQRNNGEIGLMNVAAGLHLSLGDVSFRQQLNAATVTLEDIATYDNESLATVANDDYRSSIGGLYDFSVRGLTHVGQSVEVVIPLTQAIPLDAVYRKYHSGTGWVDFVIDDNNRIASAPGELGVCPSVGDESFTPGLHSGDYCVELTIEDGGPNDHDGIANGVIKDPGGIYGVSNASSIPGTSTQLNTNSTQNKSAGGGVTSLYWLWLIMSFLWWRHYRNSLLRPDGNTHQY